MTTSSISQNLSALLASFPASVVDPDAAMAGYRIAVMDFDARQVSLAVTAFIQGRVAGHNAKFAPSAAELAIECRKHLPQVEYDAAMQRRHLPAPPPIKAITAEERARVAVKMKALADVRNGQISADEFHQITGIEWMTERAA